MYNGASWSGLRAPIVLGGLALAIILTLILPFISFRWTVGPLTMWVSAVVAYLLYAGFKGASPLSTALRAWLATARWTDWLTWGAGALVIVLGLYFTGMLWVVMLCGLIGLGLGMGFHSVIIGGLARQRFGPQERVERLVRELRLTGVDEVQVRRQVARFSGKHWEELFSDLFGYRAMRSEREELIRSNQHSGRATFWGWRDWVIDRLNSRVEAAKKEKEQAALAKVEKAGLQAEGLSAAEAEEKAWQMANAVMDAAKENRGTNSTAKDPEAEARAKRDRMKKMLADARTGAYKKERPNPVKMFLGFVLGGKPRFLLGCLLLAGFALWLKHNQIVGADTLSQLKPADVEQAKAIAAGVGQKLLSGGESVFMGWVNGIATLSAALILLLSSMAGGMRMSFFAYPAAAVAMWGTTFGLPQIGPLGGETLAAVAGAIAFIPGVFFGGSQD
jgi:hypothetical protein